MSDYDPSEKFDFVFTPAQCSLCVHRDRGGKLPPSCAAFPDGIPDEIMSNLVDHREPVEGDQGIRFEPRDSVKPGPLANLYRTLDGV